MCISHRAIREGSFFDLMYVNLRHDGFNPHRQYAFLRYTEDEALLIIANFDNKEAMLSLNIPELAIDMAGLASVEQRSKDLLWGKEYTFSVGSDAETRLIVGAHDAIILPLKINDRKL